MRRGTVLKNHSEISGGNLKFVRVGNPGNNVHARDKVPVGSIGGELHFEPPSSGGNIGNYGNGDGGITLHVLGSSGVGGTGGQNGGGGIEGGHSPFDGNREGHVCFSKSHSQKAIF